MLSLLKANHIDLLKQSWNHVLNECLYFKVETISVHFFSVFGYASYHLNSIPFSTSASQSITSCYVFSICYKKQSLSPRLFHLKSFKLSNLLDVGKSKLKISEKNTKFRILNPFRQIFLSIQPENIRKPKNKDLE